MPSLGIRALSDQLKDHAELLSSDPPALGVLERSVLRSVSYGIGQLAFGGRDGVSRYDDLKPARLSASAGFVKFFDEDTRRYVSAQGTRAAQLERLGGWTEASELTHMVCTPKAGVQELKQVPRQFDWSEWDFDPHVEVVALQEPFKIRTISIADGPATAAGSRIQKALHGAMRRLRPFQLIGGVDVAEAVESVPWARELPFVSGDYSAATDRLSAAASRVVFDSLLGNLALAPELRRRLEVGLFSSVVDYSKTLRTESRGLPKELVRSVALPATFVQKNGQLMGNILSFPILCLVNLGAYLTPQVRRYMQVRPHLDRSERIPIMEKLMDGAPLSAEEFDSLHVLINGDDILFQSDTRGYEEWRAQIEAFGLKLSVGKNLFSPYFFTINSVLFETESLSVVPRPWWGGLLPDFARARTQIKRKFGLDVITCDTRLVLSRVQQQWLGSLPDDLRPKGNDLWFGVMGRAGVLDDYKGLNWFIPIQYGGLGLDKIGRTSTSTTFAQRRLAVRLALNRGVAAPTLSPDGSLPTAGVRRTLRRLLPLRKVTGELMIGPSGREYVLDRNSPLKVNLVGGDLKVSYRLYETLDSVEQRDNRVFSWLDYHITGIRLESEEIQRRVSRLLIWGMKINARTTEAYYEKLDDRPVFTVVDRTVAQFR
jgi:hypothetical protein